MIILNINEKSEITRKYWGDGLFKSKIKPLETKICKNPKCETTFQVKPSDPKVYCSHHCSAVINNLKRPKKSYTCHECNKKLNTYRNKYCSFKCQNLHQYRNYINEWKLGEVDGNRGIKTQVLSKHIRRYFIEKYSEKCSLCEWSQINPVTNNIPLEIDHIDGNASNNTEENLRLLCPNCHSLTPYFRNLNKGNGRAWRLKCLKKISSVGS